MAAETTEGTRSWTPSAVTTLKLSMNDGCKSRCMAPTSWRKRAEGIHPVVVSRRFGTPSQLAHSLVRLRDPELDRRPKGRRQRDRRGRGGEAVLEDAALAKETDPQHAT
jgi:hypothetical protein